LLDLWRKRASSDEWIESFCDLVKEWEPMGWAAESGQIKSGVGPFLQRRQRERSAYVAMTTFPTRGDKSVRAQSIRGRMALNKLYVPTNRPWYPDFRAELLSFPAGKHDDCVDSLGLCGQLLDRMLVGQKAKAPKPVVRDRYVKPESNDVTWKTI
jgi:predicted phage terminase large subunit-like protein